MKHAQSSFRIRLLLLMSLFFNGLTPCAIAAEGGKVHLGLLLGISFPSLSSGAFGWGIKAGYKILPRLRVGGFYYRNGIGVETYSGDSSVIASSTNIAYGGEAMMEFTNGFSAGMKLGLLGVTPLVTATDSINTIQFTSSTTYLFLGPAVSYDYPLGPFLLGGEVSYFYTMSGSAPKQFNFMGSAKVTF